MSLGKIVARVAFALLVASRFVNPVFAHGYEKEPQRTTAAPPAAERLTGTVEEIIVDDRVSHAVYRLRELRFIDGASVALQGELAQSLQPGLRVEVTGKRAGRVMELTDARTLTGAATSAPAVAMVEIEGTFAVAHADDFPAGRSQFVYEIHTADGTVRRIDIAATPTTLTPGMRISVNGSVNSKDGSLRPARITILAPSPAQPNGGKRSEIPAKTANTVLVILANFNDTALPTFMTSDAQAIMTSNSNSVANYYSEVSFSQQTLAVTVTSWVTMAMSKPSTCTNPDWQAIGNAATTAATAADSGWNSASYGFVVYLFPQVAACGWNGLAYIGSPHKAYINGTNSFITQVIAHEMGHNFGLYHAGSLDCGAVSIGGSCTVSEYGDPFDTMGNQRAMHFNAEQKRKLNWIAAGTAPTHSAGTVTYSLTPIESSGGATYAIKVPTTNTNRTYWIEFRQPIGFDSPLSLYPNNGALIRVSNPFETTCSGCVSYSLDTELLDMTPGTSPFTDAALVVGQSFNDATYGVTVNVLAATASALTVQVSVGGQTASTTTIASSGNPASYGTAVTFTASVTGTAPTGTINFKDGGVSIAGCSAVALLGTAPATAACTTSGFAAGTHSIVATYSGDAANTGSSSSALSQTINSTTSTISLATSGNPSVAGATVTFTATVSGVAPTGTVNFTDGASSIAGCSSVALSGSGNIRTAACATSSLSAGSHSIAAGYAGDAGNSSSASGTLAQVVKAISTTSLGSSSNPSNVGVVVTITATVAGLAPTGTVSFTDGGISIGGCSSVALTGSGNTRSAACSTGALPAGSHTIGASYAGDTGNVASNAAALTQAVNAIALTNVALATNGGAATASSTFAGNYPASAVNDGDVLGKTWGHGGGWADATPGGFPDWVQISFNGMKTISSIVVYSLQDDFGIAAAPTDTTRSTAYGISDFDVQAWNGSTWVTLASINDNALVKRTVNFANYSTDRIRINITAAFGIYSRLVEVQAWGN